MKTALALVAALAFAFTAVGSEAATSTMMAKKPAMAAKAAPCKDAAGKFMKCPPPAPAPAAKTGPCKDEKGKFTKCPAAAPAPKGPCKDAQGTFTKCDAAAPAKK